MEAACAFMAIRFFKVVEFIISPAQDLTGMFQTIEIQKRKEHRAKI